VVPEITSSRAWGAAFDKRRIQGSRARGATTAEGSGPIELVKDETPMTSQLYLARGIVAGMIHSDQDPALVRTAELARRDARRARLLSLFAA
jgi:hypothetical protein